MKNEVKQKVIEYMMERIPAVDVAIEDGIVKYSSTLKTHESFCNQLVHCDDDRSRVYEIYLERCFNWLVLLKRSGVSLKERL